MQRIVIVTVILAIGLVARASAQPTQAELDRIDAVRQMIAERGYTWTAGVTSVSNLTDEEMKRLCGLRIPPDLEARRAEARREGRMIEEIPGMAFPSAFDWRTQGGVTPIKNQGNCGSCWDFCATAAFESQILIYSGVEENLSEQAVLSCNTVGDNCDGGWMETAYDMFISHGAVREPCMPYHEVDTDACTQSSCDVAATLDGYYAVDNTVNAIKTALLDGPVASGIAVCSGFQTYTGGCFQDNCTDLNHGVLIVGWDDTQCSGQGAWIIKNSWGPAWGINGYMYIKYGSSQIGYGAEALNYTPGQTVHFFHVSHVIDDGGGDHDGFIDIGEPITFPITILNIGATTATNVSAKLRCLTAGVTVTDSLATYADIPKGTTMQSDAPHFAFALTGAGPSCGALSFQMVVTSTQGTSTINLKVPAGELATVFADDFETNKGWSTSAAGDNATTGIWTRVDPIGTWWGDQPVQPEDDHTAAPGTMCFVTGQGAVGGAQGAMDVDGGKTTLTSPTIDLAGRNSALLTYWRWYASETGSAPNDDDFVVDVSSDNGTTWTNLETLPYSDRTWNKQEFYLEDFVALTSQMKVRFIAQDNAPGSIVEAAIDDFSVAACTNAAPDAIPPTVAVVSPNGGETLVHGTQYDVRWNATDNVGVTSVDIYLSTDGGVTYPETIASGEANDGSYLWTVDDLDSKTAKIKVEAFDAAHNKGVDASDADFVLWGSMSGVTPDAVSVPREVTLRVTEGNPVTAASQIVYGVPSPMRVRIAVYDVSGRVLGNLIDTTSQAGYNSLAWSEFERRAGHLSAGIYFIRLDAEAGARSAKVVVAR
ncbi:MAG TPA: C1 family peptidase [bacterium]|nr:C1 family peptidase [bacterium]